MGVRIEALVLGLALAGQALAGGVPEPEGYRMDDYRAPVPDTLKGARVVDAAQARALWEAGETVFVDVYPRPPRPANLPEGTLWIDKARETIPGAWWLPNTGYGRALPGMDAYLAAGLEAATGGETDHPLVFFCQINCWMSWNAAKRAMEQLGYSRVTWFPDGMDGWVFEELPVEKKHPWAP
ncbi:MAG: rhodanese [Rhodobacteraceae bacterium]|nr:rhodanese [Paracoccaceae bacterium]